MKNLKTVLITAVIMLAIQAATIYFLDIQVFGQQEKEINKPTSAEEIAELSIDTESITTNLASPNNYAVVQFNILVDSQEAKEELELRTPEVKEAIITSLASFTKAELIGEEGIDRLVSELESRLANILETGKIERILVTEYKLQ